ncbi:QsdR family transcriptional regulator [Antribacter gilvus]|uniref:QsdR family transcriptional regulator n=1 Tax=Antribacter gilvus TaxID=2304675 RepID=UPI0013E00F20|nr:QsdR family transcriptional regulator [Antribacter gilvus]
MAATEGTAALAADPSGAPSTPGVTGAAPGEPGTPGDPGAVGHPVATVGLAAAPSWLSERLATGTHPDARRAFDLARAAFIDGHRIDMGGLATTLGVDRATVFRWVGNRDTLLSEVLWSLAGPTLVQADEATAHLAGAERVAALLTRFVDDLIRAEYFRTFLRREPARALRLLTTKESEIQRRYLATTDWIVRRDLGDAPFGGAIDPASLAYLLVRVSESFTYADLITGEPPSTERARTAFRHILRVA